MLRGAVYVNGKIAPADQAVVPVYDHGFVYGEGVYETLRTYNRVPFLYDRHMRRLRQSAERLLLDVPFDDATLLQWIDQTVAAAGELQEAYIRILLTRGVGDLNYDPKSTPTPTTVIIVKPFEAPAARVFTDGIRISLVEMLRNHPKSVNPVIKSNNLLNNALAMQAAYRAGAEEALMCNYRGELTECSQANFFMVRGGAALTPQVGGGPARRGHARVHLRARARAGDRGPRRSAAPGGPGERGRDVHHLDHPRAEPGREGRRPRRRLGQARTGHEEAAGLPAALELTAQQAPPSGSSDPRSSVRRKSA